MRKLALVFGVVGVCGVGRASELVAANGITGAGTRADERARAWAELGFSSWDEEAVGWTQLGLGLRLKPWLEVEGQLPVGYSIVEREDHAVDSGSGAGGDGVPAWLGNPYFGVNVLALGEPELRWRIGAGFTLPVTGVDDYGSELAWLPLRAGGGQDPHLWQPGGPSLIGRARVEMEAGRVSLALDLAAIVSLGVLDTDVYPQERTAVLFLQPAFEVASYVSVDTLVGGRLAMVWGTLDEEMTLSLAPFLRHELGDLFAEAQFTVNVLGPYGALSSGDGPIWGMQLGVGAHF